MNNFRILRWGDYPGLPGWVQWNYKIPVRGRQEGQREERRCDDKESPTDAITGFEEPELIMGNDLFNKQKISKGRQRVRDALDIGGTLLALTSSSLGIALAIHNLKG